jgi:hypothetical protein
LAKAPESFTSSSRLARRARTRTSAWAPAASAAGRRRRPAAAGEHRPGPRPVEPGQRHDLAGLRPPGGLLLVAEEPVDAAHPHLAERHPVLDAAAPDAGQRELAGVGEVVGLEHLDERRPVPVRAQRRRALGRLGASLASASSSRRTPLSCSATPRNTGTTWSAPSVLPEVAQDLLLRRLLVLQQLLHQVVVEVGQRLQHLAPRRLLALQVLGRQRDDVGRAPLGGRRAPPR